MLVHIHTDAGLRTGRRGSAAGLAGIGFVIRDEDQNLIKRGSMLLEGDTTISEGEYSAIIFALYNARKLGATKVKLFSDSQLCVRQINGQYQCKAENLIDYLEEVKSELDFFDEASVEWVNRERNQEADRLVRALFGGGEA